MLPYINPPFDYGAALLGASRDELKLLFSFLLSYPLAGILKRLPDAKPYQKNLFIIFVALFYLVGLFDLWTGIRTLFISAAGAYAIAYYVKGPFMPWIGFVFVMGHMSVNHVLRQMADAPDVVDVTGAQMVLLTAFCWNVADGRLPEKDLVDFQKQRAIYELPNLLDFTAYVLFFPSLLAGPSFDYVEYSRWIDTSMFEVPAGTDPLIRAKTRKGRKIPQSSKPAAMKAATGLLWVFLFLQFSGLYNRELLLGGQYMQYGFLRRIWILQMFGFTSRLKYYGLWSLTEGACILSGLGYNGVDTKTGQVKWNRLQNINPWSVETAQNSRAFLEGWNINTNLWLRNYMYLRVTPKGKKPGFRASLATFATSAFWHGFYPGYYLTFVLGAFIQTIAKNFRRYVRPFFLTPDGKHSAPNKRYYDIMSYVATQSAFCFATAPFVLLDLPACLLVWSRVYFYAIIGAAFSIALFESPAKLWLNNQLSERNHGKLQRTASQETIGSPVMGLPNDPGRDIDEAVKEIRHEVEVHKRNGSANGMPTGQNLRAAVEEKLGKQT
ncbi:lysophospholipid acyltransferase [Toensbergia leucococca]|nr:lysophospholipid acyltransferase [Toensbergia leucococca]